jgi:hypothetical protein
MNSRHVSTRLVGSIRKFLFPLALSIVGITLVSSAGAQSFQTSLTEQEFTLAPGASHSLVIPVAYIPVHITVSFSPQNGGTQTPSELMQALVNWDGKSEQFTWIATSSDGTTNASNSVQGTSIANIGGGNVTLTVASTSGHALSISQSATRTSLDGHYVVTMSY